MSNFEAELAAHMVQRELVSHLRYRRGLTQGYGICQFYELAPDRPYGSSQGGRGLAGHAMTDGEVDIFRGFTFRVVPVERLGLCVALDVLTSYVGRRSLASYMARGPLPDDVESVRGQSRWVADFGRTKSGMYLLEVTDQPIGSIHKRDIGTIYAYLQGKFPRFGASSPSKTWGRPWSTAWMI